MTKAAPMAGIDWSGGGGETPFSRIGMSEAESEVSLTRQGAVAGTLRVNLRWNPAATAGGGRRGLLGRRDTVARPVPAGTVDLDLGCLYQFTDGQRGVIQAMGRRSGDYARAPFILLDRDDRIGSQTGENLFINMDQSPHFQRILVFVMVATGTDDLTTAGPVVTFYPTAGPALEFRLNGPTNLARARSCAVAQIRRRGTDVTVHREVQYFSGYQSEIDARFGWGLRWGPGHGKSWGLDPRTS